MTINYEVPAVAYTADGFQTTFPITFTVGPGSNLIVSVDDVQQVEGVDYNVSGTDVVFPVAPADTLVVDVYRHTTLDQQMDLQPFDEFPSPTIEGAFDKLTKIIQERHTGAIEDPGSAPVWSVFGRVGTVIAKLGDYLANLITFTPAGNLSSTNVQDAIEELDTEKAQLPVDFTQLETSLALLLRLADGLSYQKQDMEIVEDSGLQMDVEALGGGNIDYFSGGVVATLDCTTGAGVDGKARVALTAGVDENNPVLNHIYVTAVGAVATLQASTVLPTGAFGWVGWVLVPDAVTWATTGAYGFQRYTESFLNDSRGALSHHREKTRAGGADYESGATHTLTITTNGGAPDNVHLEVGSAVIYQMHRQSTPAFTTGPYYYGNGSSIYTQISDLNEILTDTNSVSMSGKKFNLVVWGAVNITTGLCKLYVNVPDGSYTNTANALADSNATADFTVPDEMYSVAFMIARIVVGHSPAGSGTWTELGLYSLLKTPVGARSSGSGAVVSNEFDQAFFRVYNADKKIALNASSITAATTRTITMPDMDLTLIDTGDSRLSDARTPTAHSHGQGEITNGYVDLVSNQSISGQKTFDDDMSMGGNNINSVGDLNAGTISGLVVLGVNDRIEVDTINELTVGVGVTIDTVLIKDGLVDTVDVSGLKSDYDAHAALTNEHKDWAAASVGTIHATNYVDNDTTDHTLLSNIGSNSHAQIDTHLALNDEHINWKNATDSLLTTGSITTSDEVIINHSIFRWTSTGNHNQIMNSSSATGISIIDFRQSNVSEASIRYHRNGNSMRFYGKNTNVEMARFNSSGYLGINDTTPNEVLDVGGNINASGSHKIAGATTWSAGTGTPEGAVTAPVGSLFSRTDGGAGTSFYVKESGSGNTGWVAK